MVKKFQVLLFNINYSLHHDSFLLNLDSSKYYGILLTIQLNISHLFK